VWILGLFYLGGAVAGTLLLIDALSGLEAMLAETLAVPENDRPGAFTSVLMGSPQAQRFLARVLDDRALAAELIAIPPLALFYGWLVVSFYPALVMLTASETIAADLSTGAIRFALVRTTRLSFSVGKLLGQSALLSVSVAAGALGVWLTGLVQLEGFEPGATAFWLLRLGGRGFLYCMAYVGLAVGLSHLTRSVPWSRALGLLALAGAGTLWGVAHLDWTQAHAGPLVRVLLPLLPRAHQTDLFRPELMDRLPALVMLLALCATYFALGFRHRARRDA
jgi:hypothetical protein